jgi:hypothetical protein
MTIAEKWNIIASRYNEIKNSPESEIQEEWENYFKELLGYSSLLGEIDSQRNVHFGTRERGIPDIIIRVNNNDLFDVELKQYSLPFSNDMQEQLISYLKQLRLSVGILVCKKIYVFVYDYVNDIVKKTEIAFTENNPDGEKFVELFQKSNFSKTLLENFIDTKSSFDSNVQKIKNELTSENVTEVIKLYLEDYYSTEEINFVLKNISIEVKEKLSVIKHEEVAIDEPLKTDRSSGGMDYSRYCFQNNTYGKSQLVLAVVKAYVKDNPSISYSILKSVFTDKLQGSTGVVATPAEARAKRSDPEKRYHTKNPIYLLDGPVWVCTQWGKSNIGDFIDRARSLGYKIDKVGK